MPKRYFSSFRTLPLDQFLNVDGARGSALVVGDTSTSVLQVHEFPEWQRRTMVWQYDTEHIDRRSFGLVMSHALQVLTMSAESYRLQHPRYQLSSDQKEALLQFHTELTSSMSISYIVKTGLGFGSTSHQMGTGVEKLPLRLLPDLFWNKDVFSVHIAMCFGIASFWCDTPASGRETHEMAIEVPHNCLLESDILQLVEYTCPAMSQIGQSELTNVMPDLKINVRPRNEPKPVRIEI